MNKNWLIRTKNNHILGPISKEKVKELITNGSIKGDDEVCSGNGYWLYVRETELVSKYILENNEQSFNPVQEAKTTLARSIEVSSDEDQLPCDDDLEFPELSSDDQSYPSSDDLSYPDEELEFTPKEDEASRSEIEVRADDNNDTNVVALRKKKTPKKVGEVNTSDIPEPKKKLIPKKKLKKIASPPKSLLSTNILYILVFIFFITALASFYFRKNIFSQIIEVSSNSLIPGAHAQEIGISKKKSGLI